MTKLHLPQMLCLGLLLTVVLSPYSLAEMQDPEAIPLYPGKAPGSESWTQVEIEQQWGDQRIVRNVVQPALLPYLAEPDINTGQAVIVAPGGGFKFLSIDQEGVFIARWLNERGIKAFVLKYRTDKTAESKLQFFWQGIKMFAGPIFRSWFGDSKVDWRPMALPWLWLCRQWAVLPET